MIQQIPAITHPLLALVPLFPLLGALFVYARPASSDPVREESTQWWSGWIATLFAFVSFACTVAVVSTFWGSGASAVQFSLGRWFEVGDLQVDFGLRLDTLNGIMCLVITGVGSLIHLYAIGYMAHDPDRKRFFTYLNLFLFAMLLLVLGDNMLLMFVGWEGVGLCSYLLIGFWFKVMPNAQAGQKAFVVNRIGDAGFLIGMFTLFLAAGTVNFQQLGASVASLPPGLIEFAAIALFIGAVGKSAQIPLYVWLPDAMAGPTPVSALIHAATMVTAGVYMTARMAPLYIAAPNTSAIILVIGALTALLAASIALVQTDIKKVLAYSTVSQLGFMFMAVGAFAYSNGLYHVVTHAFFKACLFMAAGSVIIGCHHQQDMRQFGGLRKYMPYTFATYLIATLAIAGFPFLSGFFSKDAILWAVYSQQGLAAQTLVAGIPLSKLVWGVGLFTAFLTAFYMTRSLIMTFFGTYRGHEHPHESPWVVTVPLVILAALSAGFGFLYGEAFLQLLRPWARGDLAVGHDVLVQLPMYHTLEMVSIGVALAGIAFAVLVYSLKPALAGIFATKFSALHRALEAKWWVDELYDRLIVRPLMAFSAMLFGAVDRTLIDGSVNGSGVIVESSGEILSRSVTGHLSHYLAVMYIAMIFLLIFVFLL